MDQIDLKVDLVLNQVERSIHVKNTEIFVVAVKNLGRVKLDKKSAYLE